MEIERSRYKLAFKNPYETVRVPLITPQCHVDGPEVLSIAAIMPLTLPVTTFSHRGPLHEVRIAWFKCSLFPTQSLVTQALVCWERER